MIRPTAVVLVVCVGVALAASQGPTGASNPLARTYRAGENIVYTMKGVNRDWHYEIQADGIVRQDAGGTFVEEYTWSNLVSDGKNVALSPATGEFRQRVTLDQKGAPAMHDLSKVDPRLIGPITDFMTFYADLWLAAKSGKLVRQGDRFYFDHGKPASWADGTRVLIGEDSIAFDMTLKALNSSEQTATVLVRHVPPEKSTVRLSAEWMRTPVGDTPNNWVQVSRTRDGRFQAAVGKETFDVEMKVSLADGKILAATIDNRVLTSERDCEDEALSKCSAARPVTIDRKIEIALKR